MRTRKYIASALAAVTAAGAVLATAGSANAERYRHRHNNNDDEVAAAIIGGVAGLALGAMLSDGRRDRGDYYSRGYYSNGYYGNGYSYDPRYDNYGGGYYRYDRPRSRAYGYYDRRGPRTCVTRDRVYDPYIGRRVTVERRYRC